MSLQIVLQFTLTLAVCYFISGGAIIDAFPQGMPNIPDMSQIPGVDKFGQFVPSG